MLTEFKATNHTAEVTENIHGIYGIYFFKGKIAKIGFERLKKSDFNVGSNLRTVYRIEFSNNLLYFKLNRNSGAMVKELI